jgi:uncharacterized membrane protein YczE
MHRLALAGTLPVMLRLLSPVPPDRRLRRGAQLFAGLVLYGVSAGMIVLAAFGLDPWDVLHQGLSRTFGLGIGTWAILASLVVLLLWWPLGQRPGLGTVCNAVVVGVVIDLMLSIFHPPHVTWARIVLLIGGVVGNGLATGLYIGAGLGPGPRDGLSVGIAARGHSMRVVRTTIEATVIATGFLLGGTIGIGTVFYALAIGPITHWTIPALAIGHRPGPTPPDRPLTPSPPQHPAAGHPDEVPVSPRLL